jgi:membrane-associated phospholipid phosphatase
MLPTPLLTFNRILWLLIAIGACVDIALARYWGLDIIIAQKAQFALIIGVCAAVALFNAYIKRNDTLFLFGNIVPQAMSAGAVLGIWNYLTARFNLPLIDDQLIAIDHALGFDWQRYIAWVDTQPQLGWLFTVSYQLFAILPIVVTCLLFMHNQPARAQRMIFIFYTTGLLTILLAGLFPAMAGYVHYNIDLHHFQQLHPAAARSHEAAMLALRNHSMTTIPYPGEGLVTFPSFHAVMAVLLIYASLKLPVTRWLIIPLCLAMLAATPVDGGHYLTDVLAGILIALAGIWLAHRVLPKNPLL